MPDITIRLSPSHTGVILISPEGREFAIPEREGWGTLLGILGRLSNPVPLSDRQAIAREKLQTELSWPPGLPVRFTPPHPSPWREAKFWTPPEADSLQGIVVSEAKQPGFVVVKFPTTTIQVPAKFLTTYPRKLTLKGKFIPTLEDLGL